MAHHGTENTKDQVPFTYSAVHRLLYHHAMIRAAAVSSPLSCYTTPPPPAPRDPVTVPHSWHKTYSWLPTGDAETCSCTSTVEDILITFKTPASGKELTLDELHPCISPIRDAHLTTAILCLSTKTCSGPIPRYGTSTDQDSEFRPPDPSGMSQPFKIIG